MEIHVRRSTALALALTLSSTPLSAQGLPQPSDPPTDTVTREAPVEIAARIDGTVVDLSPDSSGRLLYCTREGQVGRYDPATRSVTVLATAATGPFPIKLVAVAENLAGDVVVLDEGGDLYELPGGATPAVLAYDDLYMIHDATDFVIDGRGNHIIASKTPSSGVRATNFVSPDGLRWDYLIVEHSPLQLAADPLTGDLFLVDQNGGGALRTIAATDNTHPTTPIDTTTQPGPTFAEDDGDVAVEAGGDAYWVVGGDVWKHDRSSGTTELFRTGYGQLRAAAIAGGTGFVSVFTPWSLYVAEGENPTLLREIGNVRAPASVIATDFGYVPSRGSQLIFTSGVQVFEIATDNQGNLLLGGHQFGAAPQIRRYDTQSGAYTLVADDGDGLTGAIEGIVVAPDDTIYALTREGVIHQVTEGPLSVTTVFSDPLDKITAGKDLAMDVNGTFYVADRDNWGAGEVVEVSGGVASTLVTAIETRGLAADPATGGIFVSEWNGTGFCGSVGLFDFQSPGLTPVPGLAGMNYTNDFVWGDGDMAVTIFDRIYTISEDDWSLIRYEPQKDRFVRVGSSYTNHPSGLAIAPSTPGAVSPSGFSLYVAEFDFLWEKANVWPAASPFVDSQAAMSGVVVGVVPPRLGRPRDLVPDPAGTGAFVSTSSGALLHIDLESQAVRTVADRLHGLTGDLTAVAARPDGRLVVASREGRLVEIDPARGFAGTLLLEGSSRLQDVRGLVVDDVGDLWITEHSAGGGRLFVFDGTELGFAGPLAAAQRPAFDPRTGDLLVTSGGKATAGGLVRIDRSGPSRRTGRREPLSRSLSTPLRFGEHGGGLALDGSGNAYVTAALEGRVLRLDGAGTGATGGATIVSGGFARPTAVALSPGPEHERLLVLDGFVVYALETGAASPR